jgi:glycosyltransferase involved in cell wall biosynthesis
MKYALFTPAKNEEKSIGKVIESVLAQTVRPEKWVIISDNSTDRTDDIIKEFANRHDFIHFHRVERDSTRNFGSKAFAIREGLKHLEGVHFDYIGNLDADIVLEPDYFENLISRMEANISIGIGGGIICELDEGVFRKLSYNLESVAGAVQLFRARCFEQIGGYVPLRHGGIDAIAEVMSRMHGWKIRTYDDLEVCHLGKVGLKTYNDIYRYNFRAGIRDYHIGNHLLFVFLKSIKVMFGKPYLIGGIFRFTGYMREWLRFVPPDTPPDVVRFVRKEQLRRMIGLPG